MQKHVLDHAHGAPTLASAANIGAFNLGNALAAWLGGMVISAGFGYTAPNAVGAVLAASALIPAVLSHRLQRKDDHANATHTFAEPDLHSTSRAAVDPVRL